MFSSFKYLDQELFLSKLSFETIDFLMLLSIVANDEFGRAARRGKVDLLGLTLKKRIAQIRRAGQAELVFLVDSSASVGSDNFYNEIKFIRKVSEIFHQDFIELYNNLQDRHSILDS